MKFLQFPVSPPSSLSILLSTPFSITAYSLKIKTYINHSHK
jgi:hypothetical protein